MFGLLADIASIAVKTVTLPIAVACDVIEPVVGDGKPKESKTGQVIESIGDDVGNIFSGR